MTQFGGRGGSGAELQCRKRRGSSKDGGVTPLKVKHLNYCINGGRFTQTYGYACPEKKHPLVSCHSMCNT